MNLEISHLVWITQIRVTTGILIGLLSSILFLMILALPINYWQSREFSPYSHVSSVIKSDFVMSCETTWSLFYFNHFLRERNWWISNEPVTIVNRFRSCKSLNNSLDRNESFSNSDFPRSKKRLSEFTRRVLSLNDHFLSNGIWREFYMSDEPVRTVIGMIGTEINTLMLSVSYMPIT